MATFILETSPYPHFAHRRGALKEGRPFVPSAEDGQQMPLPLTTR